MNGGYGYCRPMSFFQGCPWPWKCCVCVGAGTSGVGLVIHVGLKMLFVVGIVAESHIGGLLF